MEILVAFLFLLVIGLAVWLVVMQINQRRLAGSFRALMSGRGGVDLETILMDYVARMDRVEQTAQSVEDHVRELQRQLPYVTQHVGIIRFNPFSDQGKGGDQSFVVAILDDHADGIVITALHSRNDVRVYGKPVVGGQSTYTLTTEEKDAIARAMKPRA